MRGGRDFPRFCAGCTSPGRIAGRRWSPLPDGWLPPCGRRSRRRASPPRRFRLRRVPGGPSRFSRAITMSTTAASGGPPKFPNPASLLLLRDAGAEGRRRVVATLREMGQGAIYDQLGGGFHRYTLDAQWRVPHFEKMLYDNAHLAELLALAWQAEKDPELARLARGTF